MKWALLATLHSCAYVPEKKIAVIMGVTGLHMWPALSQMEKVAMSPFSAMAG
jgi:hypothetical protein